jgi:assimilatory nitrate reductase catalytic subunit
VFWPCPSESHPGTPRLFEHRFPTADGRARFHAVEHGGLTEVPDEDYPYYLTTGRLLQQYQSGTQTRRVASLREAAPEATVSMHDVLARRIGVRTGDLVRLRSRRGTAVMRVRAGQDMHPDTVFAPFHYGGEGAVNLLTNPELDPHSRMPEFKACAIALERVDRVADDHAKDHAINDRRE